MGSRSYRPEGSAPGTPSAGGNHTANEYAQHLQCRRAVTTRRWQRHQTLIVSYSRSNTIDFQPRRDFNVVSSTASRIHRSRM